MADARNEARQQEILQNTRGTRCLQGVVTTIEQGTSELVTMIQVIADMTSSMATLNMQLDAQMTRRDHMLTEFRTLERKAQQSVNLANKAAMLARLDGKMQMIETALKYPMKHDIMTNWHSRKKIEHHIFYSKLRVDPEAPPELPTEVPLNPTANRGCLAQNMLATFLVPAKSGDIQIAPSMQASGQTTDIVADSRNGVSHTGLLYGGYPYAERVYSIGYAVDPEMALHSKVKLCSNALNVDTVRQALTERSDQEKTYERPVGNTIAVDSERSSGREELFQFNFVGKELSSDRDTTSHQDVVLQFSMAGSLAPAQDPLRPHLGPHGFAIDCVHALLHHDESRREEDHNRGIATTLGTDFGSLITDFLMLASDFSSLKAVSVALPADHLRISTDASTHQTQRDTRIGRQPITLTQEGSVCCLGEWLTLLLASSQHLRRLHDSLAQVALPAHPGGSANADGNNRAVQEHDQAETTIENRNTVQENVQDIHHDTHDGQEDADDNIDVHHDSHEDLDVHHSMHHDVHVDQKDISDHTIHHNIHDDQGQACGNQQQQCPKPHDGEQQLEEQHDDSRQQQGPQLHDCDPYTVATDTFLAPAVPPQALPRRAELFRANSNTDAPTSGLCR
ncbi:unnamed protein product, partial [Prorocentrum cordatum]